LTPASHSVAVCWAVIWSGLWRHRALL